MAIEFGIVCKIDWKYFYVIYSSNMVSAIFWMQRDAVTDKPLELGTWKFVGE